MPSEDAIDRSKLRQICQKVDPLPMAETNARKMRPNETTQICATKRGCARSPVGGQDPGPIPILTHPSHGLARSTPCYSLQLEPYTYLNVSLHTIGLNKFTGLYC